MLYKSKLKGSFGRIYPISIIIVYILCIFEVIIRLSLKEYGIEIGVVPVFSFLIMGGFFAVMGIIQLFRYRLWINLVLGVLAGVGCILAIFIFDSPIEYIKLIYVANILVIVLLIIAFWPVLAGQERYESNARRIFKLAAEIIEETAGGYTSRPFSAGNVAVSEDDLQGFARFVNGKHIARAFNRKEGFYLAFSLNKSVMRLDDPAEVSYLSINYSGEVTVQITPADYKAYRAKYNFDQLCASMADVFIRFLNYYREGKEDRIITELKTAR